MQRVFGAKRTNLHEKYDYPFQRVTNAALQGDAGIRMPPTEQHMEDQQRQAEVVVIGCAREAVERSQRLQLWGREVRYAHFAEVHRASRIDLE